MWCSAFIWDVESWKNHYSYRHDEKKQDQLQNHNLCWSIRDLRLQSNQLLWNPKTERELQGRVPAAAQPWRSMRGEEAETWWRGKTHSATALRNCKVRYGLAESTEPQQTSRELAPTCGLFPQSSSKCIQEWPGVGEETGNSFLSGAGMEEGRRHRCRKDTELPLVPIPPGTKVLNPSGSGLQRFRLWGLILWKTIFPWIRDGGHGSRWCKCITFIVHFISNLTPLMIWQEVLIHSPDDGHPWCRGKTVSPISHREQEKNHWTRTTRVCAQSC